MTQRDYVSRGRSPKKKTAKKAAPKTRAAQTPVPLVSRWRIVAAVSLLVGFVAFLWSIKDKAPPVDAPATLATPKPLEQLPELPKEEWEYIKTLPGYEVEVEVAQPQKSDKRYLMQCASFRTRAQAEEMKARIAFQGYESQVRHSAGENGEWFRVILGPFDSKREAEKTKHSLAKVNVNGCQIWFWNL